MTGTWRPLALAAALIVTLAAAATAQTVIVTKTPPGTAVELGVNATAAGKGTSDAKGIATIPLNTLEPRTSQTGKTEMDVRVFVDVCEKRRHVWLAERGWQPPAVAAGCSRREMFGVFALQRTTTLVVEAAEESQAVWIRQGVIPPTWLDPNTQPEAVRETAWEMVTGLILFGGAGSGKYQWSDLVSCGSNVDTCSGSNYHMVYRAGADFWLNRFMGVTAGYFKAREFKMRGAGSGYRFTTTLAPDVAMMGGKGGFSIGRVRVYGDGGATYQRSNLQTTESINPIVTNGVIGSEGGTQVVNLQTAGWSWYVAGGLEIWTSNKLGIYGEAGRVGIDGKPRAGGEGYLRETVVYAVGGIRLRVR